MIINQDRENSFSLTVRSSTALSKMISLAVMASLSQKMESKLKEFGKIMFSFN